MWCYFVQIFYSFSNRFVLKGLNTCSTTELWRNCSVTTSKSYFCWLISLALKRSLHIIYFQLILLTRSSVLHPFIKNEVYQKVFWDLTYYEKRFKEELLSLFFFTICSDLKVIHFLILKIGSSFVQIYIAENQFPASSSTSSCFGHCLCSKTQRSQNMNSWWDVHTTNRGVQNFFYRHSCLCFLLVQELASTEYIKLLYRQLYRNHLDKCVLYTFC